MNKEYCFEESKISFLFFGVFFFRIIFIYCIELNQFLTKIILISQKH